MGNAIALACHELADQPCLYRDDLVSRLIGLSPETVRNLVGGDSTFRLARFYAAARSRFVVEAVAEVIAAGIRQIVVLDAGLVTIGCRKTEPGVRVFETDYPSEQTWKRYRLADIGAEIPDSLHFVEADAATLASALAAAGFDHDKPALFSWTGIVSTTPLPEITATLEYVGSCPGARLIFDYIEPAANGSEAAALVGFGLDHGTVFTPREAADLLRATGFEDIHDQPGPDVISRYLSTPMTGSSPFEFHMVDATARGR
jgi:methyltransferase (TIGR00027 family)